MTTEIVLWLFVIFSGIGVGAGFYEIRVELPQWFARSGGVAFAVDAGAMNRADSGRRFWGFVTTGPLTLLTVASLLLSWPHQNQLHLWWAIAAGTALFERVGTFTFFIPQAVKLMRGGDAYASSRRARRWISLNRVRMALASASWLCALKALTLL